MLSSLQVLEGVRRAVEVEHLVDDRPDRLAIHQRDEISQRLAVADIGKADASAAAPQFEEVDARFSLVKKPISTISLSKPTAFSDCPIVAGPPTSTTR